MITSKFPSNQANSSVLHHSHEMIDTYNYIRTMVKQENLYQCHDYLKCNKKNKRVVDAAFRSKVWQWITRMSECANLHSETAVMAMNYIDRYFCSSMRQPKSRREYQLVAMTSLYLAIKIFEQREIDATTISGLSGGLQSGQDILSFESSIVDSLRGKMQCPTALWFVHHSLQILTSYSAEYFVAQKLYHDSQRQIKLSVGDYACVCVRQSSLAIASVLNSLDEIGEVDFPLDKRTEFVQALHDAFGLKKDCLLITTVRKRLNLLLPKNEPMEDLREKIISYESPVE